jgi:hypothetical protein
MVEGDVETVGLISGGNANLQSPPQPIHIGSEEPNQGNI